MNKYFCVAITFWQYVKIGWKEFHASPTPSVKKSFWVNFRDSLIGSIIGLVIGLGILWILQYLNWLNVFAKVFAWFIGIVLAIEVVALIIFLFVSWRKAVRDCWDKFQAG